MRQNKKRAASSRYGAKFTERMTGSKALVREVVRSGYTLEDAKALVKRQRTREEVIALLSAQVTQEEE